MHVSPNVQVTGQSTVDMTKVFVGEVSSYGIVVVGEAKASKSSAQSNGVYTTVTYYE